MAAACIVSLSLAAHYLSLAAHSPSLAAHSLSLAAHSLSLAAHSLSLVDLLTVSRLCLEMILLFYTEMTGQVRVVQLVWRCWSYARPVLLQCLGTSDFNDSAFSESQQLSCLGANNLSRALLPRAHCLC